MEGRLVFRPLGILAQDAMDKLILLIIVAAVAVSAQTGEIVVKLGALGASSELAISLTFPTKQVNVQIAVEWDNAQVQLELVQARCRDGGQAGGSPLNADYFAVRELQLTLRHQTPAAVRARAENIRLTISGQVEPPELVVCFPTGDPDEAGRTLTNGVAFPGNPVPDHLGISRWRSSQRANCRGRRDLAVDNDRHHPATIAVHQPIDYPRNVTGNANMAGRRA